LNNGDQKSVHEANGGTGQGSKKEITSLRKDPERKRRGAPGVKKTELPDLAVRKR